MPTVRFASLERYLNDLFIAIGFTDENAFAAKDVFLRATLRGVGHHDIYMLPMVVQQLEQGKACVNPEYRKQAALGGLESWDAGGGIGPLACSFAMDRAMLLADEHGIGLCAVRNTNHFIAAFPYLERAAEQGYIALLLAKGGMSMGYGEGVENCMSALPMGFAYPVADSAPVVFDACMAYASQGKLHEMAEKGIPTPPWWGVDEEGKPTTDAAAMLRGTRYPIGGHKGFSLALLGEVLTSVLSMGCILDQTSASDGLTNASNHTAVAIRADALMPAEKFEARTAELSARVLANAPAARIPGSGTAEKKKKLSASGEIDLSNSLLKTLEGYAGRYGIAALSARGEE